MPREWLVKAGPWLRAASVLLRNLLPVSLAGLELGLDDTQWKTVSEQLARGEKGLAALTEAGDKLIESRPRLVGDETWERPVAADGSLLRTLHGFLREMDPSFAGLERVRAGNRYLWVHPHFVDIYRPPLPEIPT